MAIHQEATTTYLDRTKIYRFLSGISLNQAAREAKISAPYLQKIEGNKVPGVSPNILHRLAPVIKCNYGDLLVLAGYVHPSQPELTINDVDPVVKLGEAIGVADLTIDEALFSAVVLSEYRKTIAAGIEPARAGKIVKAAVGVHSGNLAVEDIFRL